MADLAIHQPFVPNRGGSESRELEYRLVWPNGDFYGKYSDTQSLLIAQDDIKGELKNLGVPSDYFPTIQARVVQTTYSEWSTSREAEYLLQAGNDES